VIALEGSCVEALGEGHPGEEPTIGSGPPHSGGEVLLDAGEHEVALVPIGREHPGDVGFDVESGEVCRGRPHVERPVLGVGGELEQTELLADLGLGEHPSQAQAGRENLGEAPKMDDPPTGVEALDAGQPLPVVTQLAVGRVLEDHDV